MPSRESRIGLRFIRATRRPIPADGKSPASARQPCASGGHLGLPCPFPPRRLAPSLFKEQKIRRETPMARLKFGAFLAPHHPIGEHPMLQFGRDLDFVEQIDAL